MRRWPVTLLAGMTLLAGCAPSSAPTLEEPPTGALEPTAVAGGTLYATAELVPAQRQAWLERIERSSAVVADAGLGSLDDDWDGQVIVELPVTTRDYTVLAGSGSDTAAAVTRCDPEGSRIAINPRVRAESADYLDSLLLHEAVHVATGSACTDAPLWIEEGLAEWLTAEHHAATQQANQQWLDHELAVGGLPTGLPADASFWGSADQVSGAYALAAFAVATAIEQLGQDQAMAFFAAPDESTTGQLTEWYLAGLRARLPG